MHGSCESVGSIRSTRRPRISAAHWKLEDLPSEISAEFVEEELNLKSNSQLQFEFPNYAFAIIKLCKIEMRSSLFFVNLKREHFCSAHATNFKWNKNRFTRSPSSVVKSEYLHGILLRRRRYKKKRREGA